MRAPLLAALWVEARKFAASRVVRSTAGLLVGGVGLLAASLELAAQAGNEQVLAQLGDLAALGGWGRFVGIATQITAAASLLAFGVVSAWSVGREFSDGTISGLFALPVSRQLVVVAKLIVFTGWAAVVAVALVVVVTAVGLGLDLGVPDSEGIESLGRLLALIGLSCPLAVPAAWAATIGRGLLPGIATSIVTIAITQVAVVAGSGAWFPIAAPALWAIDPGAVAPTQLILVAIVPILFGALAVRSWANLQLDR